MEPVQELVERVRARGVRVEERLELIRKIGRDGGAAAVDREIERRRQRVAQARARLVEASR